MRLLKSTYREFIVATLLASLVGCGGSDDSTVAPQVSNLADCHNPSMYTVGNSWTVTLLHTQINTASQVVTVSSESTETLKVLAPPAEWALPPGVVRIARDPGDIDQSGGMRPDWPGTYVRATDDLVETLFFSYYYSSRNPIFTLYYSGHWPSLPEPIRLPAGEKYIGTAVQSYVLAAGWRYVDFFNEPGKVTYSHPPLTVVEGLTPEWVTPELTYIGPETIAVPAGTFTTCHVSKLSRGTQVEEWRVAEGPYKGITVKSRSADSSTTFTRQAKQVSASWQ